ncbi:phosphoserine phosphatase [Rodentibacter caecimuris]|uniref:Phosphoserine phosphatase n=1 Tax=Rodentibacter caecimuris TaxID=1796644 RepID=A0ABX3KYW5_9PAST|nr:phosphoserine phosphatase SerB [Rodentibacter heylii]
MPVQNLMEIRQKYSPFPSLLSDNLPTPLDTKPFILYGPKLTLNKLQVFQKKCGQNFICFEVWNETNNLVILLKGEWKADYIAIAHELFIDIAPLNFSAKLSQSGLLVMDMDSTAIQIECIDEIAKLAGTGELVSSITAQAMRGELDFKQSLRRRVATLKNAPESILQQVRANLPLMPGLQTTLEILQKNGWKTAIASGGFTYFADHLKQQLHLDFAVSNQLDIANNQLTGQVIGDIVDAQYKANTLQKLAKQYNIPLQNTIAIGDGANDLAMMKVAGLGIALHAKPKVQQHAQIVVNFADFSALLCLLSANDKIKE